MKYSMRHIAALFVFQSAIWAPGPVYAQTDGPGKAPTFTKEVIGIFQEHCHRCHRPGAPFVPMSLHDYTAVRPWAKAIHKKVMAKDMPPWHADDSGREFSNDISLSQEDMDTIDRWVRARAPRGGGPNPPPPEKWVEGWHIGEPDLVLDTGVNFEVAAIGEVAPQYFRVTTDLEDDRWIAGLEARPGNRDVVKQIDVFVEDPNHDPVVVDTRTLGKNRLGMYAPGIVPPVYRAGKGRLLKAGAVLILKILYVPNGEAASDRSQVAIRFHNEPALKPVITMGIAETKFEIPPHAKDFSIYATHTFAEPVTLLNLRPLMHYRGERFTYIAHYPDGKDEVLLNVIRYNYDWQTMYHLKEPVTLPAGTVLECIAGMDNSHENLKNPESHSTVYFGDQPTDEKMIGWVEYTVD